MEAAIKLAVDLVQHQSKEKPKCVQSIDAILSIQLRISQFILCTYSLTRTRGAKWKEQRYKRIK